jgi:antitoxin MazE
MYLLNKMILHTHMETTIQKWGNSLAVRVPKQVATKLALRAGSRVEMHEATEGLLIRQTLTVHRSLKDLVRMIHPNELHGETEWGSAHGNEVW